MALQEKHYNLVKNSFVLIEDYKQGSKAIEIHHYNKRIFISIVHDKIVMYTDNSNIFTRSTTNLIYKLENIESIKQYYNEILKLYNMNTIYYDSEMHEIETYSTIITQMTRV